MSGYYIIITEGCLLELEVLQSTVQRDSRNPSSKIRLSMLDFLDVLRTCSWALWIIHPFLTRPNH